MPIHILPPEIASQIAAGEVIERPASVVKELLENALDAGAGFISIATETAGRRLIEVADDGCGIPRSELALSVSRHATSKLSSAEDLFHIKTLGFRGEALASIGSVSRLSITSRTPGETAGARLKIEGGQVIGIEAASAPQGTVVRVEDLFFNVPARLKFLKSEATERSQIDSLVTRYALAYPQVRFHLVQEKRPALQTSGNGDYREVLATLYGVEMGRRMLEVVAEYDEIRINGFISPLSMTRSNRREILFFVNGRPVQDVSLVTAMIQAYHTLLMVGRYPMGILLLTLAPEDVDVNVHPAKAEVRFREKDRVFSAVRRGVRLALMAHSPLPEIDVQKHWSQTGDFNPETEDIGRLSQLDYQESGVESGLSSQAEADLPLASLQPQLPSQRIPLLRLIGQIASTYLVAEGPDGLYLIDQHAAHERVLFEGFFNIVGDKDPRHTKIPSQILMRPVAVELPVAGARLLTEQLPNLARWGFEVEPFGPGTFMVRSIPAPLSKSDPGAMLRVLVEDFEEDETPLQSELEARLIARICKRAAVKAGQTLTVEEQAALLHDLERCHAPRTCPHGRPTMIHLSVDLLERQFGRRGAL